MQTTMSPAGFFCVRRLPAFARDLYIPARPCIKSDAGSLPDPLVTRLFGIAQDGHSLAVVQAFKQIELENAL
jgi:hypothetical protein